MKILIGLLLIISFSANSQKTFPSLDTYGGVFAVPEAEYLLDPNKKYKIVGTTSFGLSKDQAGIRGYNLQISDKKNLLVSFVHPKLPDKAKL